MKNTQRNKLLYALNMTSIMTLFLYASAGGFESVAIQACIEAWPSVSSASIRLMMTLPALVQSGVMILIGPFIGKAIKYRTAAIVGMLLITLGGCIPFFFYPTWGFVLACRSIGLGYGGGLLGMRNALLLKSVPAERASHWIGCGAATVAVMSVISAPITGMLVAIGWNYSFLVNSMASVCLVIITLFLHEPVGSDAQVTEEDPQFVGIEKMNGKVYYYSALLFIATCLLYSVLSGVSTFYTEKGIGSAALAGTAMSAYALAGVFVNLVLPVFKRVAGKYLACICALFCTLGIVLLLFVPGYISSILALILCGVGYFPLYSIIQVYNGETQPSGKLAFSSLIILTCNQLAVFFSSFFISFCGNTLGYQKSEVSSSMLVSIFMFAVMAVMTLIWSPAPKKQIESSK